MATIARHLRNVARKSNEPLKEVHIAKVVEDALAFAKGRLDAAGALVTLVDLPADLPLVRDGPVRLQQVIVNVLSNAADAVEGLEDRRIAVTAAARGDEVTLSIRDHGPVRHRCRDAASGSGR